MHIANHGTVNAGALTEGDLVIVDGEQVAEVTGVEPGNRKLWITFEAYEVPDDDTGECDRDGNWPAVPHTMTRRVSISHRYPLLEWVNRA